MDNLKEHLITLAEKAMAGKKCECHESSCNCHYTREDAENLVTVLAPVIVKEVTDLVHNDLASQLS